MILLHPWILSALVLLPGLYWLLRVLPPPARRLAFPAMRLLAGLSPAESSARRTPLWLVLLRLLLALLVILAAAHPILSAGSPTTARPLLLVVDDGWAAAHLWSERRSAMEKLIDDAAQNGQTVALLPTAPPADGGPVALIGALPAAAAREIARGLVPKPWPVDRAAAARSLDGLSNDQAMRIVWLADGLDGQGSMMLAERLRHLGSIELVVPPPGGAPKLLLPAPAEGAGPLGAYAFKADDGVAESGTLLVTDPSGQLLDQKPVRWEAGQTRAEIRLDLPNALRNRVARLALAGEETAGAVALLDDGWHRHPVGLLEDQPASAPLLDDLFYVGKALDPLADLRRGSLESLLAAPLSMLVMDDRQGLAGAAADKIRDWVEKGGVLVRFAGPRLAANPDRLLPVGLLSGGRNLGGTMSWTRPMALAPMPAKGPLAGLAVPPDVRITAQVLAEPSLDLDSRSWARLEDGTPLVTGAPLGKGWLVLVHCSAGPAWSNLGVSGLLPEMLRRFLALSQGLAAESAGGQPRAPWRLLDGFGRLAEASGVAEALPSGPVPVSPRHPPGLYGREGAARAFNLGPAIDPPKLLPAIPGASLSLLGQKQEPRDWQPWLLQAALLLFLLDFLLSLAFRGLLGRLAGLAAALLLIGIGPSPARAGESEVLAAALHTRLAYVVTNDPRIDAASQAGLSGLTAILARRSTAVLDEPAAVSPERDVLMPYPLLYWPVRRNDPGLTSDGRAKVNDYLRHGGMILFDTQDGGAGGTDSLRVLTEGIDIPPLAPVTATHVLAHAFYLLRDMPGRYDGAPVYAAQKGDPANDGVSPVVIGGNDWADAWATDARGQPLFPVIPGGEAQREMAYRFGINLVMVALTGSYKDDQVHLQAIMDRLRK